MNRPKCQHVQTCPCKSCQDRSPTLKPWVEQPGGYLVACGGCGHTMSYDDWMALEWEFYKAREAQRIRPS